LFSASVLVFDRIPSLTLPFLELPQVAFHEQVGENTYHNLPVVRQPTCIDGVTGYIGFNRAASIQTTNTGNAEMAEGIIKKLKKGFGFIDIGGRKDLFFHSSAVQGVSFQELREGQKVSYTEGQSPTGPCAENVKPV
jgi:CspA family cold shock protein